MPVALRIDVNYPVRGWYETYHCLEKNAEEEQQEMFAEIITERAKLLPGRKVIEKLGPRHFLIDVMPLGEPIVSWVTHTATLEG